MLILFYYILVEIKLNNAKFSLNLLRKLLENIGRDKRLNCTVSWLHEDHSHTTVDDLRNFS